MTTPNNERRPLSVADLIRDGAGVESCNRVHWYWCRRHEQAHSSVGRCPGVCPDRHGYSAARQKDCGRDHRSCISIGPFMSQREANWLRGGECRGGCENPSCFGLPGLGMEVVPNA